MLRHCNQLLIKEINCCRFFLDKWFQLCNSCNTPLLCFLFHNAPNWLFYFITKRLECVQYLYWALTCWNKQSIFLKECSQCSLGGSRLSINQKVSGSIPCLSLDKMLNLPGASTGVWVCDNRQKYYKCIKCYMNTQKRVLWVLRKTSPIRLWLDAYVIQHL